MNISLLKLVRVSIKNRVPVYKAEAMLSVYCLGKALGEPPELIHRACLIALEYGNASQYEIDKGLR